MIAFGAFSLDEETGTLWSGNVERRLRAKSFAVLRELLRRRGRLVTREELFRACWPGTAVSQTVLRVSIAEIRALLAEDPTRSTRIENVGRRGYRIVADLGDGQPAYGALAGRERELALLRRARSRAHAALRQLVFVSGEPGLGKTTLLDHFTEAARATTRARVAWGQCVELTGDAEPYAPVLDVLGRLCADDAEGDVLAALERWAPSWLLQMPGVLDGPRAERARRRVANPTRERMLRELADALEALAAQRLLVVVLEDLHWSDTSSVDALAYLAQRSTPAQLLVLGSYRPMEVVRRGHPLRAAAQTLLARRRASEIALAPLAPPDVAVFLQRRLAGGTVDPALADDLHARTRGNPLFLAATVDELIARGLLTRTRDRWRLAAPLDGVVPDSLRHLAQRQLERLTPDERSALDAASVAGSEFTTAAVAAAIDRPRSEAEDICAGLAARTDLIAATGVAVWPDGTTGGRYEFRHVLYRDVLEAAVPATLRPMLHRRVGEVLERAWGNRTDEIAGALAVHFQAAGDASRAVRYRVVAADRAKQRSANPEVVVHLRAALERLDEIPDTAERAHTELGCLMELGSALVAVRGAGSDDVLAAFGRALAVADALGATAARFQIESALFTFAAMRADLHRARDLARDLLRTADRSQVPFFAFVARVALGCAHFNLGDVRAAAEALAQAHGMWRREFPILALDPGVLCRAMLGFTTLHRGQLDAGARWIEDALAHAQAMGGPYNRSYARELAAQFWASAGRRDVALEHADLAKALAARHGFVVHAAVADTVRGWALRDVGGLRAGIDDYEGASQYVGTSLFRALLVEVLLEQDRVDEALAELAAIRRFVDRSGERRHLAELDRLEGECRRRRGAEGPAARACFERALARARADGTPLWAHRAEAALRALSADHAAGTTDPR
jgi:DNA-binding winged helix-turn-helix (wHTH) protein/tetratricopeptide (TPR) repeat protein